VHYKKLSKIVKETAEEYGLPYHSESSFTKALLTHAKMLKKLGQPTAA
jgi:linoleoyl-CoA desaturase